MHYLKKLKTILQSNFLYVILIIITFLYVFTFTIIVNYKSKYSGLEKKITGRVISYKIDGDKLSMLISSKEKIIMNYYFSSEEEKTWFSNNLKINDQIYVDGEISKPKNNTIFNTFNYKKYLYNQKIYYIFNANKIVKLKDGHSIKNIIIKKLNTYKRKDYMYSFILGDKSYLDDNNIKENGISHLLAISGMHVSFIISFIKNKLKIKNDLIINIFLCFYAYLVSFQIGVLRILLFRWIKCFFKSLSNIKSLLLSAIILLFINPFYIYNVGFLYSFLISGAIMIIKIDGNYLFQILKISLISLIISLPITINLNYEINIIAIINNIIFVPFVTFIIFPMSFLTLFISKLEFAFDSIVNVFDKLNKFLPVINIIMPKMNWISILIYYLILFLIYKYKKIILYILLVSFLIVNKYKFIFSNNMNMVYLDVSQGDSQLVIMPKYQNVILIDSGGKSNYMKKSWKKKINNYNLIDNVILYIKSLGITKINYFIVTHGDFDHMGEAINLVENFKVENVIFNCGEYNELEKENKKLEIE